MGLDNLPTDANGIPYATQVCETLNTYGTSTVYYSPVVTSTTYCYNQNAIYYQQAIDLVVVIVVFIGVIWLIMKAK
jgi:hypothetical protein